MYGGIRHPMAVVLSLVFAGLLVAAEQSTKEPPANASGRDLAGALKDVINRGANLYNSGDQNGSYRLFEGALLALRPQLEGRPDLRKKIDDGLRDAEQHQLVGNRAWALYELLRGVRQDVIAGAKKSPATVGEERQPPVIEAPPPPPPPEPPPKQPAEKPAEKPVPSAPVKPPDKKPAAAAPEKKEEEPTGNVTGVVTMAGKPLAGVEVRFVPVDDLKAKGHSNITDKDGTYELLRLKTGRYRVLIVPGESKATIPERYGSPEKTPLRSFVSKRENKDDFSLIGQ